METLYYTIEINKILESYKEVRKYYITKDESYGIKITKTENDELVEKEVLVIKNVITTKQNIQELMDKVILCEDDYNLVIEIVKEYAENQINDLLSTIEITNIEERTGN